MLPPGPVHVTNGYSMDVLLECAKAAHQLAVSFPGADEGQTDSGVGGLSTGPDVGRQQERHRTDSKAGFQEVASGSGLFQGAHKKVISVPQDAGRGRGRLICPAPR